jgi:hypothetical protein
MELTLDEFVLCLVSLSLALVGGFGLISRLAHWRGERRLQRTRTVCRLCGHVFLNDYGGRLIKCRVCDGVNRRRSNGKLG